MGILSSLSSLFLPTTSYFLPTIIFFLPFEVTLDLFHRTYALTRRSKDPNPTRSRFGAKHNSPLANDEGALNIFQASTQTLFTQIEPLDQLEIAVRVRLAQVIEETPALPHHLQKASP